MASKTLQAAGMISLITVAGHTLMGVNELSPAIAPYELEASTALNGWYQGSFLYALMGINYLRLAGIPPALFTRLDWASLATQISMHLFTLLRMRQTPPKVLSTILTALAVIGVAKQRL